MKPPLLFYHGNGLVSNWTHPLVDYLQESLERFSAPALVHASQAKSYRDDRWDSYEAVGFAGVGKDDEMESAIGGYFRVKFPKNLPHEKRYDFDWQVLKKEEDPFGEFQY